MIHSLKLVDYLHVQADKPWYNYYITRTFVRLIPITWWEEISVQNVNFTKFRTLNKTVIRILTQNDVFFKCKLFCRKVVAAENTDQAAHLH